MSQESRTAVKTETEQKKKRLTVNLPPETHHAFKVWCTQQGREMSEDRRRIRSPVSKEAEQVSRCLSDG